MDPRPLTFNINTTGQPPIDPTFANAYPWGKYIQFTQHPFEHHLQWNLPGIFQHCTPPLSTPSGMPNNSQPVSQTQFPPMTQSSNPTPTPQSATTSTGGHVRPRNWTQEEDKNLCKAWINVSTDAIVGTGQRLRAFWERIHAEFSTLIKAALDQDTCRVVKACENRWGIIHPEVSKWSAALNRVHSFRTSGFNQDDEVSY